MIGTLVNAAAIIVGSIIGLLIQSRLPQRIVDRIFQVIGLFTIYLGMSMAIKANEILFMILSLVIGTIIGELFDIEKYL